MSTLSLNKSIPVDFVAGEESPAHQVELVQKAPGPEFSSRKVDDKGVATFIEDQKRRQRTLRASREDLWTECWALYRGVDDFSDKEDWQSQIVSPKSWNAVKQATNLMMRLLRVSDEPWNLDAVNPDDLVSQIRATQLTDLLRVFWDDPDKLKALSEGLESSFIMGVGVWKVWWGFRKRKRPRVVDTPQGRQVVVEEILEGRLFVRAVDPFNFYWLPGSKFNQWQGTIEEIETSKWELLDMARQGVFGPPEEAIKRIKNIQGKRINAVQRREDVRFNRPPHFSGGDRGMETVTLTEYYGPILDKDGHVVTESAHVVYANDNQVLIRRENPLWSGRSPYVAFSPLLLPFREEGVGIVEMAKSVQRAIDQLLNMQMDTLMFKLLPTFEAIPDVFENPEELETGLVPGKILKKNAGAVGQPAITPVLTQDISAGSIQVQGILDRSFQEGSLVSEILQSIPRFRGNQTLGEIELKAGQQNDFMSSLAKDIDEFAIKPLVELSLDWVLQFLDTSNDPRVASILGVGHEVLRGMSPADIMELVQGDYIVKVSGITDQIQKAEQLQNLVQFLNVLGQNPQDWLPFIKQDQLLQRILESFQPGLRDIHNLVEDPATVEAKRRALQSSALTPEVLKVMPQIIQLASDLKREGSFDQTAQQLAPQANQALEAQAQEQQFAQQQQAQLAQLAHDTQVAELQARIAEAQRIIRGEAPRPKQNAT